MTQKTETDKAIENNIDRESQAVLRACSADAGFYRLVPEGIFSPKTESEIIKLYNWCVKNKKYLIFRGAGTSLSGQAQTDGIMVETRQDWDQFTFDAYKRIVKMQPGVRCGKINDRLRKYGLKIGPDPASINSCLAGGMLANNSSGMRSGTDKNPYSTLESMRFILANGLIVDTSDPDANRLLHEKSPEIFKEIGKIKSEIENNPSLKEKITRKYRIKNTIGYSLNAFTDFTKPVDILAHLMIGSEGTLGFISEASLRLFPEYTDRLTGLLFFGSIRQACEAVPVLKESGAVVVELMDNNSLLSVKEQAEALKDIKSLPKETAAILFEYEFPDKDELNRQRERLIKLVSSFDLLKEPKIAGNEQERQILWKIRQGLLPSLATTRQPGSTVIIEDVAFPPESLAEATVDLQELLKKHGYKQTGIYGHAKDGNLHFMIAQSFNGDESLKQYDDFTQELASLVVDKYDGSLKAEHGTGRSMAPFVEKEWGTEAYNIMKRIKKLLDPHNILNPGVLINEDKQIHLKNIKTLPLVDELVDKCMECGFCEPSCPSRDLTLSPRKRIVLLREMERIRQSEPKVYDSILKDYEYLGVDTCATDGLCSIACPAGINTGELVKKLRNRNHTSRQNKAALFISDHFAGAERIIELLLKSAHITQRITGAGFLISLTKAAERISGMTLPKWNAYTGSPAKVKGKKSSGDSFVYFPCCISRMTGEPSDKSVPSVVELIEGISRAAGIEISVPEGVKSYCCGMAFSSKGYKEAYRNIANRTISQLWEDTNHGRKPVIFDSSSCAYTVKTSREYLTEENRQRWDRMVFLDSIEYIHDYVLPVAEIKKTGERVVLHPNCTVQKMNLTEKMRKIALACSDDVYIPSDLGCCGYAGDRGLLFPELNMSATQEEAREVESYIDGRESNTGFYSSNTSCETGMSAGTGKRYYPIAWLVYKSIISF